LGASGASGGGEASDARDAHVPDNVDVSTLAATNLAATTISIFYVHVQEDAHDKAHALALYPPLLVPPLSHSALKPTPTPPQNHTKEPHYAR